MVFYNISRPHQLLGYKRPVDVCSSHLFFVNKTGVEKKGDKSVWVGHQYCCNVGKTANSQVAVIGCLSNGDFTSMVDARLCFTMMKEMN